MQNSTQAANAWRILFLLFLANMQRGLVRHGFAESGDTIVSSTFFIALALCLVFLFWQRQAHLRMALFFGASFCSFILLKYFPFQPAGTMLDAALVNNSLTKTGDLLQAIKTTGRTIPDSAVAQQTNALKQFLDKQLKPGQTFLDFSSTPMLYYYCHRPVPGYFNQNLQNTVDDFLQRELLKAVDTATVPVVVFASYPRAWADASDGIPNVSRYYLLAEYIFENYRPYGVIGGRSIWLSNAFKTLAPAAVTDTLLYMPDTAMLQSLPEYTGLYFNNNQKENAQLKPALQRQGDALGIAGDTLNLHIDTRTLGHGAYYLEVQYKQQQGFEPYTVQLDISDSAKNRLGIFSFIRRDWVSSRYLVRLSNHYFWYRHSQLDMQLWPAREIHQISILKDLSFENQAAAYN